MLKMSTVLRVKTSYVNNVFQIELVYWLYWFNVIRLLYKNYDDFIVTSNLCNSSVWFNEIGWSK